MNSNYWNLVENSLTTFDEFLESDISFWELIRSASFLQSEDIPIGEISFGLVEDFYNMNNLIWIVLTDEDKDYVQY